MLSAAGAGRPRQHWPAGKQAQRPSHMPTPTAPVLLKPVILLQQDQMVCMQGSAQLGTAPNGCRRPKLYRTPLHRAPRWHARAVVAPPARAAVRTVTATAACWCVHAIAAGWAPHAPARWAAAWRTPSRTGWWAAGPCCRFCTRQRPAGEGAGEGREERVVTFSAARPDQAKHDAMMHNTTACRSSHTLPVPDWWPSEAKAYSTITAQGKPPSRSPGPGCA